MKTTPRTIPQRQGSALLVVVLLTGVMAIIIGSLLKWGLTEKEINEGYIRHLDAQNAAESVVEFGVGQLAYRWEAQTNFNEDDLAPSQAPLSLTSKFNNMFNVTNRDYDTDLVGGVIELGSLYIHPNDPANEDDPHKGKLVSVKSVQVYGRASVTDTTKDKTSNAYAVQTLQLRDAPLFSHAVFYNMDLEFHPGPSMVMNGPVHANGDIWLEAINSLTFEGNITATGDFRYGYMLTDTVTQTGNVRINNGRGGYASPYKGSGSKSSGESYWDSDTPTDDFIAEGYNDWREFSKNHWGGNLQDAAHDVPNLNPVGFNDYVRDNPETAAVDDDLNYGYAIIEPPQPAEDPTEPGFKNPAHKGVGEKEKFSHKAGLIIKVHYSPDGVNQHDGSPLPAHAVQLKSRPYQNNPYSTAWDDAADFDRNGDGNPDTADDFKTNYYVSFNKVKRADPHNNNSAITNSQGLYVRTTDSQNYQIFKDDTSDDIVYRDDGGSFYRKDINGDYIPDTIGGTYSAVVETVEELQIEPVEIDLTDQHEVPAQHTAGIPLLQYEFDQMFAAYEYDESGGDPESSFYDPRRGSGIDAVEINLEMFQRQLEGYDGDTFTKSDGTSSYTPSNEYNGLVYVEFPTDPTPPGPDGIVKSLQKSPRTNDAELGLLLTNASDVPNPSYNQAAGRDEGFTLATNNALYIKGDLNADGDPATGSNTGSDDPANPDPPVAVVADAVMPLSNSFLFENTREGLNSGQRNSSFTEFNAAIIQGLRPTDKEGSGDISGGNHNFPRFLEKWTNVEFRYRGSMVALFESEVAPQGTDTAFYSPPIRNWGFYDQFGAGNFPPGTPNVRSYRKFNFRFMTKAEWESEIINEVYDPWLAAGIITQDEYDEAIANL